MTRSEPAVIETAGLRARAGGYLVDMVIFGAITMLVTVVAGFILLWRTGWAEQDATDPEFYTFLAIIGIGAPLAWTILNVSLLALRGQTGGQYVAALRMRDEEGGRMRPAQALVWWFCFNPLLFSWPTALVAGLPLAAVIAIVLSRFTIVVWGVIISVCIAAPMIALVSAMVDRSHRALHDRVARVAVVPD